MFISHAKGTVNTRYKQPYTLLVFNKMKPRYLKAKNPGLTTSFLSTLVAVSKLINVVTLYMIPRYLLCKEEVWFRNLKIRDEKVNKKNKNERVSRLKRVTQPFENYTQLCEKIRRWTPLYWILLSKLVAYLWYFCLISLFSIVLSLFEWIPTA